MLKGLRQLKQNEIKKGSTVMALPLFPSPWAWSVMVSINLSKGFVILELRFVFSGGYAYFEPLSFFVAP
jgi:hypothetical protein